MFAKVNKITFEKMKVSGARVAFAFRMKKLQFMFRAVPKIDFVIATARYEAGSNLYFYMKKQIASV
ncbi:MAG: hypothetical protein V1781_09215, partial [Bacteroidota bacterium]